MAKTTRATEARRLKFTPELLANVRRRFEASDEPLSTMAADLGCCNTTLRDIAKREGWVRYVAPPRNLSTAARLRERAEKLAAAQASNRHPEVAGEVGPRRIDGHDVQDPGRRPSRLAAAPLAPQGDGESSELVGPPPQDDRESEAPAIPTPEQVRAAIAALHADVSDELADFKAFRDGLKTKPSGLLAREQLSRTFAHLTATLHRLQMMLASASAVLPTHESDIAYDDMPADLDAFREQLAQRIETFLASRSDAGIDARVADDGVAEAAP